MIEARLRMISSTQRIARSVFSEEYTLYPLSRVHRHKVPVDRSSDTPYYLARRAMGVWIHSMSCIASPD